PALPFRILGSFRGWWRFAAPRIFVQFRGVRAPFRSCELFYRRGNILLHPRSYARRAIMLKGFKDFIMRGNVIDLAVAVVIGAAFNTVVERVVESLVNPIIGVVFQADSLDNALLIPIGNGEIALGS